MLTRQDNYTACTVHANCTWLQTIKQIHSEALHLTFKPHTLKLTFYKYLTGSKNGKAYQSCHSFMQPNQLTIETLKTIQIREACNYSQNLTGTDCNAISQLLEQVPI